MQQIRSRCRSLRGYLHRLEHLLKIGQPGIFAAEDAAFQMLLDVLAQTALGQRLFGHTCEGSKVRMTVAVVDEPLAGVRREYGVDQVVGLVDLPGLGGEDQAAAPGQAPLSWIHVLDIQPLRPELLQGAVPRRSADHFPARNSLLERGRIAPIEAQQGLLLYEERLNLGNILVAHVVGVSNAGDESADDRSVRYILPHREAVFVA